MLKNRLMTIYDLLYNAFGPRHWWPADTPFEVIIGAILTQNVSWKNVEKAIAALKEIDAMTPEAMAALPTDMLAEKIRPAGYFNMKAKKIKAFMEYLYSRYDGSLDRMFQMPLPVLRKELLSVYGIGQETADSIILYAGNMPIFVVDAYTKRIFSRLGLVDENYSYEAVQRLFMDNLPRDTRLYNEYHALIVAAGNMYCGNRKKKCGLCPLGLICTAADSLEKQEGRDKA